MTAPHIDPSTLARVLGGDHSGNNVTAPGPNNIDRRNDRSMSVTIDPDAPEGFVVHSHSAKNTDMECRDYVRRLAGLPEWKPTPREPDKPKPKPSVVCHYVYEDQNGEPYLRVTRKSDKSFAQSHWDIDGWQSGKPPGPVVPYRLPEILANADQTIHLVEGEKSADYLRSRGLLATTAPGGGSAFPTTDEFAVWFDGQRVRAYPDNDATGRKWAERVAARLPHADIVWLPGQPEKSGADDWLQRDGRTIDDLIGAVSVSADYVHESETQDDTATSRRFRLSKLQRLDPEKIRPREWILNHHLIRKFVSLTVSPGGLGKSSMTLVEGLSMAANRPLFDGMRIHEKRKMRVVMWNGEDPQDENMRRLYAAMKHYGVKYEEIEDTMIVESGREKQIKFAAMLRGEVEVQEEFFVELEDELIDNQTDVFTVDPFIQTHGVSENDNGAIDLIIKRLGRLADRVGCAVEIVHHVRKPSSGNKAEPSIDDARGASALKDGIRSGRFLAKMPTELITPSGLTKDEADVTFAVTGGKGNMAPVTGKSQWFRMISVPLNNSDEYGRTDDVGVCVSFAMPETEDGFPDDAAVQVQRIAEAKQTYRHWTSGTAPAEWFGFAVAREFGMHEIDDKTTIRRMIATWLKSGVLKVVEGYDGSRNTVKYIASSRTIDAPEPSETDDGAPF